MASLRVVASSEELCAWAPEHSPVLVGAGKEDYSSKPGQVDSFSSWDSACSTAYAPSELSTEETRSPVTLGSVKCAVQWDVGCDEGLPQRMDSMASLDSACSTAFTPSGELSRGETPLEDEEEEAATSPSGTLQSTEASTPKRFEESFELRRMLGEGCFGIVHRCVSRESGEEFAVKIVQKAGMDALEQSSLEGELRLHKALPVHPRIVSLRNCFDGSDALKLVMDLCTGGDLYMALDDAKQRHRWRGGDFALSEKAAGKVVQQLLEGLAHCHLHGIVHRDVKPENILLTLPMKQVLHDGARASIKLCDFGYAAHCDLHKPPELRELVGSADYVAPEVARRQVYGCSVDVWGAGVVLFECLRGQTPFEADCDAETLKKVRNVPYTFNEGWAQLSEQSMACVKYLMQYDVEQRPTAAQAQEHPWLQAA